MSRMYDRILTRGCISPDGSEVARDLADKVAGAELIVADEVAEYFFELAGKGPEDWELGDDIPNVAPPFEKFFIECNRPRTVSHGWQSRLDDGLNVSSWGAVFLAQDLQRFYTSEDPRDDPRLAAHERSREVLANSFSQNKSPQPEATSVRMHPFDPDKPAARWLIESDLFMGARGDSRPMAGACGFKGVIVEDGTFAPMDGGMERAIRYFGTPVSLEADLGVQKNTLASAMALLTDTMYLPLLLTIAFLHCKNVSLAEVSPPEKLSKKHDKKHGAPLSQYKVLDIDPMKEVLDREGGARQGGLKRSVHICRGHFRTYTPERGGPFGREIEESYTEWVSQHTRGSKESGEVRKSYRVQPGSEHRRGKEDG